MREGFKQTLQLIREAKTGDQGALNEVCGRYLDRVHHLVRFRLGGRLRQKVESMDIVQEVMLTAVKDIEQFDTKSESRFINWLARIVENTIRDQIDYYLAQKRRMTKEDYPEEIADKNIHRVTYKMGSAEKMARLEKALDQLKDQQKEVIILKNYAGMTFKEIAALFDKKEDAVRMLFVRSMDKLTDLLAKQGQHAS